MFLTQAKVKPILILAEVGWGYTKTISLLVWTVHVKHAFRKWRLQATLNPTNSNPVERLFRMSSSGYMKNENLLLVADWGQLIRNGRVKEISMTISMKARQVTDSFRELRNADLTK